VTAGGWQGEIRHAEAGDADDVAALAADLARSFPFSPVEEILVRGAGRGQGAGRALMVAFEGWAAGQGCGLVALATRRAGPFYLALGYQESAVYFRKVLVSP
jgi:GNAT superfamily N-acetyltransferase